MTREEISQDMQDEIFKEENAIKRKIIIKRIIKIVVFLLIFFFIFEMYVTYVSTTSIVVKEQRIINKKIPDSFNGIKIVQFSDLHYGSTMGIDNVKKIVKMINDCEPDIVVFTGDLINNGYKLTSKEQEEIINEFKKIKVNIEKYAITGEEDGDNFTTIFNQSNFNILNDSYDLVYNNTNEPIMISGISYSKSKDNYDSTFKYFNTDNYNSNIYNITLVHQPDVIDEINGKYNSDLYLAGHSHNGNIRLPFIGSFINKDGSKIYHNAYYDVNGTPLYISSGLGTNNSLGFRLFCHPSISLYRFANKKNIH